MSFGFRLLEFGLFFYQVATDNYNIACDAISAKNLLGKYKKVKYYLIRGIKIIKK
jgi:hypothetical protein